MNWTQGLAMRRIEVCKDCVSKVAMMSTDTGGAQALLSQDSLK
jgi:hypothetical protein